MVLMLMNIYRPNSTGYIQTIREGEGKLLVPKQLWESSHNRTCVYMYWTWLNFALNMPNLEALYPLLFTMPGRVRRMKRKLKALIKVCGCVVHWPYLICCCQVLVCFWFVVENVYIHWNLTKVMLIGIITRKNNEELREEDPLNLRFKNKR